MEDKGPLDNKQHILRIYIESFQLLWNLKIIKGTIEQIGILE